METLQKWGGILALVAMVIAIWALVSKAPGPSFGDVEGTTNFSSLVLSQDLTVGDDITISGGSLALTTSNTATSTASLGCIQTTATSTATPIKLRFYASSSPTALVGDTGPANFVVYGIYGNCP